MQVEARILMVLLLHDRSNRSCGEDMLIHNSRIYRKVTVTPVHDVGI